MRGVLAEPLLHFLAIGALMFAVYAVVSGRGRDPATIVVSQGQIEAMGATFERTWQRAPTPEDVKGLVDDHVREEVLYREGVAQGLDRDDQLIRRRVRQKVEFLRESLNAIPEPGDAVLQAYLDAHPMRFARPVTVTFRQVYLGTAPDGGTTQLIEKLNRLGDSDAVADLGRVTQLDARMAAAPPGDIERVFGRAFAEALVSIPADAWHGPLASSYGLHLVRVTERSPARSSALDEVRELVKREWLRDELAAANEKYYEGLRSRYAVRIENPRVALQQ